MCPTESSEIILITAGVRVVLLGLSKGVRAVLLGLSKKAQEHVSWAVPGLGPQPQHAIRVHKILGQAKSTPPAGAHAGPGGGLSRGPVAWACHLSVFEKQFSSWGFLSAKGKANPIFLE